jgi:hypothetical protein
MMARGLAGITMAAEFSPEAQAANGGYSAGDNRCGRCGRRVPPGFRLRGGDLRCWRHVMSHPAVYRTSLLAPLAVDLLLTPINQGSVIIEHGVTGEVALKIVLTYAVCFFIATFAALWAARIRGPERAGGSGAQRPPDP